MVDVIIRQDAIDVMMRLQKEDEEAYGASIPEGFDGDRAVYALMNLPSAQQSKLTQMTDGMDAEEQYEFLDWLMHKFSRRYDNSYLAIIAWLKGEIDARPN